MVYCQCIDKMTLPTQTGWYNLQFSTVEGGAPTVFLSQFLQQTTSWTQGIVFLLGTAANQMEFWYDAGKIAIPLTPGVPPGSEDASWLKAAPCPPQQDGFTLWQTTTQSDADAWQINASGALSNSAGILWDQELYLGIGLNCASSSTSSLFPVFSFVAPPPPSNLPAQSGWYIVKASSSVQSGYLSWSGGLSIASSTDSAFYFDADHSTLAVGQNRPWSNIQGWLTLDTSQCWQTGGNDVAFSLGTQSQAHPWMILKADNIVRSARLTEFRWGAQGLVIVLDCLQPGPDQCIPPNYEKCPTIPVNLSFTPVPNPPAPDLYSYLGSLMAPVPPGTPDYELCQGASGGDSQLCFYNHAPSNPNVPVFAALNPNPNAVIGYGKPGTTSGPTVYLQQPNDALQLNNMQPSVCFDSHCSCPGENPQVCAQSPDSYCYCQVGTDDQFCGLSCAPGLTPVAVGNCQLDPLHSVYIQHYQCFPTLIYGVTNQDGSQTCVEYAGPNPPPGQTYTSSEACHEQWADCPAGYKRYPNMTRPGCYRVNDYRSGVDFACSGHLPGSCDCDPSHCNGTAWISACHGPSPDGCALGCYSDCIDAAPVPPWGFYCADSDSGYGNKWVQNQSDSVLPAPSGNANFGVYPSPEPFCVPGVTGYAN